MLAVNVRVGGPAEDAERGSVRARVVGFRYLRNAAGGSFSRTGGRRSSVYGT